MKRTIPAVTTAFSLKTLQHLYMLCSNVSDYLYYAMLGLGIFYLLFTIISKLVNQKRYVSSKRQTTLKKNKMIIHDTGYKAFETRVNDIVSINEHQNFAGFILTTPFKIGGTGSKFGVKKKD